MRLIVLVTLDGCLDGPPISSPPPPNVGSCVGEGRLEDTEGTNIGWFTQQVDLTWHVLSFDTWRDSDRTQLDSEIVQVYDGDLLLESATDADGDGVDDFVSAWEYDTAGRVTLAELRVSGSYDAAGTGYAWRELSSYGPDGLLSDVDRDLLGDGTPDEVERYTWVEGRKDRMEFFSLDSSIPEFAIVWSYVEPPPGLDHIEATFANKADDPTSEIAREFDDAGNLVHEESSTAQGYLTSRDWSWNEEGQLLANLEVSADRSSLWTWAYGEAGLVTRSVFETDDDLDGRIDSTYVTDWSWSCGHD